MKISKIFLCASLIITTISNPTYAEDVVHLNVNEKAPIEGMLFSMPASKDLRVKLLERDTFEAMNKSLNTSNQSLYTIIDVKDKQLDIVTKRNNDLASSLQSSQNMNTLEKFGWFFLGVAASIATLYGVRAASK